MRLSLDVVASRKYGLYNETLDRIKQMTALQIAEMANRAEIEILKSMNSEMRNWYLKLPRDRRVKIAQDAFQSAIDEVKNNCA